MAAGAADEIEARHVMAGADPPSSDPPPSAEPPTSAEVRAAAATDSAHPAERTDPRTLEMLVCPVTKGPLAYDAERAELISRRARLAYPIRSGVPLLTREAARPLTDDDDRRS